MRYLSDEWIAAVADEIGGDAVLAMAARSHSVAVTQIVNGTPFGEVAYHLVCRDGKISFGKGKVPCDVTFTQSYTTAVDVALARINAAEAFISGTVRFAGDHEKIVAAQPLFAALDAVFARVRARTQFD